MKHLNRQLVSLNEIIIDVGIDGLPLFKSSKVCLWPILGKIANTNITPFIIGVYCGKNKPLSPEDFMSDFCSEVADLQINGFKFNDEENVAISFKIRCFICDTPAKSFITGTKHHNSFHGCHKCCQIGF